MEPVNSDEWTGEIAHFHAGNLSCHNRQFVGPLGRPICGRVLEAPDEPDPYSHEELRWSRVLRRWERKHRKYAPPANPWDALERIKTLARSIEEEHDQKCCSYDSCGCFWRLLCVVRGEDDPYR